MALETHPDDHATIDKIFREAHTMKGAAGMVGMMRVSRLAHRLEDLLVELRSGTIRTTPELTDAMLLVVDGMGRLITSASAGNQDASDEAALERLLPTLRSHPEPAPMAEIISTSVALEPQPEPAKPASNPAPPAPPPPAAPPAALNEVASLIPHAPPPRVASPTLEVPMARIDELNRLVGEASAAQLRMGSAFGSQLHVDPDAVTEYRDLTKVINQLQEATERTRMVPVGTLEPILHRTARDTARAAGKDVRWEALGLEIEVDRGVLEELVSPLVHIVRNSVGHGVEMPQQRLAAGKPQQAVIRFHASQVGSKVVIEISDDGAGIDVDAVRAAAAKTGVDVSHLNEAESLHLIFGAGISTAKVLTEDSGRGVGLDVVANAVASIHGTVEAVNHPGQGVEFRIVVPITLTVIPCLIVSIAGQPFAVPLHRVLRVVDEQPVEVVSGRKRAVIDGRAVTVSTIASLVGLAPVESGTWLLLGTASDQSAFQVDAVLSKRDLVVRGLTGRLRDLEAVAGASVEPSGSILLVLDVPNLIARSLVAVEPSTTVGSKGSKPARQLSVLVVDDALMVRELQRSMLERAGYAVRTASDGTAALEMLTHEPADLVVTDLEMPNMDGFVLTRSIRANAQLANIPVLIVSSHVSQEDHLKGLDAGADAYIVKTSFDEAGLLSAVSGLLVGTGAATLRRTRSGALHGAGAPAPEAVAP
ncbi:MAG: response regulator [Candidatus Dormiibacterota bacterium]